MLLASRARAFSSRFAHARRLALTKFNVVKATELYTTDDSSSTTGIANSIAVLRGDPGSCLFLSMCSVLFSVLFVCAWVGVQVVAFLLFLLCLL